MNDYMDSLEEVINVRKEPGKTELTKLELKQYRKYVGKLNWFAQSTKPDLCYTSDDGQKECWSKDIRFEEH